MAEDSGNQQEGSPENLLKHQLSAAVRKIEWTYAIYWSTSINQQGVLSWGDGYYNGNIKTRKATQEMEFQYDEAGQERSEQLRELYQSLSEGDCDQQTRRPSDLLSPEDLTDTEWYYLVCMSFTLAAGKCLPGKAFMNNQHIWLTNAEVAESNIFSRSLLAKSASIQTVACFPFTNGVLEFGTSELISEDPAMVQQLITFFLETPIPVCTEHTFSPPMARWDEDTLCSHIAHDSVSNSSFNRKYSVCQTTLATNGHPALCVTPHYHVSSAQKDLIQDEAQNPQVTKSEELDTTPDGCSNECCQDQNNKDPFMINEPNHTLEVQMIDGDISNGLQDLLNSRDYTSISFVNAKRVLNSDDSHYIMTLATILRRSQQLRPLLCFPKVSHKSCFTVWKRDMSFLEKSTSQKLLKTMLMKASWICGIHSLKAPGRNDEHKKTWKLGDDLGTSHVLWERRRRDKLNEKFSILKTLIPSISMVDKASILGNTIEYLKDLERRVEELESCRQFMGLSGKREHPDISERTSDNYGNKEIINGRICPANKRKACDIEADAEHHWILARNGHAEVNVTVTEEEVLIQMHCPWRDYLMLEIVESISNLHLDPFSVQSSTSDGIVSLTIKSKFRNSIASPGMIKRSLQRIAS